MDSIMRIDGREVKLRLTAATPIRYRKEFHTDLLQDLMKLGKASEKINNLENMAYEDIAQLNFEVFYQIIWFLAKEASPEIAPYEEWLGSFDALPLAEIAKYVSPMVQSLLQKKTTVIPLKKKHHGKNYKKKK